MKMLRKLKGGLLPFKGNVARVQLRGDDGGGEPLRRVLLRRLHGRQEGGRVAGRQHERLRVHHLLLVVHLHHHGPIIWEDGGGHRTQKT